MCGILALIETPWESAAAASLATLHARGPDAQDIVRLPGAVLGHARLAVIDLAGGKQPMHTPDGRYTIVFNGEIYNFQILREELAARGHVFATHSDTEVILRGYVEWQSGVVRRLDGMFAFAIWDRDSRTVFAARDRIGIKPLFYSTQQGFSLASTLAPFFRFDGFPRQLDYEALRDFLAFQAVLAPATFLKQVRQLPPASWLVYHAPTRRLTVEPYWTIPAESEVRPPGQEELAREFDALLQDSVRSQLVSDVPLGAFLSGGIDSSLMVHYMAGAGAKPVRTFSMRFGEAAYDETRHAEAVARQYGTEHHIIDAPDIGPDRLLETIVALDQPLADPAYITTAELSRLTRTRVTVALSGDGGDELFGGYARFLDIEANHPDTLVKRMLRALIASGLLPGSLRRRSLAGQDLLLYRRLELGPYEASRKSLKRYLGPTAWQACRPEKTLEGWRQLALAFGGRMDSGSLMRADLWTYLSENCLVKTDRASMLHSLEVRVPMLANAVLDRVLALPARVHFDDAGGKVILRRLAQMHLPEQVWNRPKHGFSVPLQAYFKGQWQNAGDEYFGRSSHIAPFLDSKSLSALWSGAKTGAASRRLAYTFLVLLIWLDKFKLEA
ncbi:MAG: asparagine synthase (glutamine-hydrolyzing) [Burkholderiales bacterium]|nr:asparagine synthase (glutamine-hydrolyzing) [Burkholderiales bacterium]